MMSFVLSGHHPQRTSKQHGCEKQAWRHGEGEGALGTRLNGQVFHTQSVCSVRETPVQDSHTSTFYPGPVSPQQPCTPKGQNPPTKFGPGAPTATVRYATHCACTSGSVALPVPLFLLWCNQSITDRGFLLRSDPNGRSFPHFVSWLGAKAK